jgi:hypothetical protein
MSIAFFLCLKLLLLGSPAQSFILSPTTTATYWRNRVRSRPLEVSLASPRYGPQPGTCFDEEERQSSSDDGNNGRRRHDNDGDDSDEEQVKRDFQDLLERIVAAKDPSHLPSILSKNMDLILRVYGRPGGVLLVESAFQEVQRRRHPGDEAAEQLLNQVLDLMLSSAESFVEEARELESQNKRLLGKIIRVLADKSLADRDREDALDALMAKEAEHFTPGFLRHVESECDRVAGAPRLSPESSRLLEILRLVQARAVEELGRDLGEAAQVLGQLAGYESASERLAILDAGVTVRGLEFAREMLSLSEEALEGFGRVPGGADPDLVECVREIRDRLTSHIDRQESFQ